MEFFKQHETLFNLVAFIIGCIGILITAYQIYFQKKTKQLSYVTNYYQHIIGKTISFKRVKERFGNDFATKVKKRKRIYILKIALWNSGGVIIEKNDLAYDGNILIKPDPGVEITSVVVWKTNEPANAIKVKVVNGAFYITFDFLEPDNGCILRLFYTAVNETGIELQSRIKGARNIKHETLKGSLLYYRYKYFWPNFPLRDEMLTTIKAAPLFFTILNLIILYYGYNYKVYWCYPINLFLLFLTYIYFPRENIPETLDEVYRDFLVAKDNELKDDSNSHP